MIVKPSIRSNFFTNAHPLGIQKMIHENIELIKRLDPYEGPKNVLIIGGSSGYGLATRMSLAFGAGANTINVSFENYPKGQRTGSAGYWNNLFFQHETKQLPTEHFDFNGDAFSPEMKDHVIQTIKETFGQIDLLVYSLASGVRKNYETDELIRSQIKPLGQPAHGQTIDLKTLVIEDLTVEPATEQETQDTVFVMGGSDWHDWVTALDKAHVLSPHFKTISYTYIGGPNTDAIYRGGTLGHAKDDLEKTAIALNQLLKTKYQGEALISSSKAIVSKASVFIPQMPIYVSLLFDVMLKHHLHETTTEHKHRLYKDMVYGKNRLVDEQGRVRLDHREMQPEIQTEVAHLMNSFDEATFFKRPGTKLFVNEFFNINGFNVPDIDEETDVDVDDLVEIYQTDKYQNI
ncbi:MAG: enoyl-ACP reductase FabV [Acholeplasmataceae bacterium]|nr:trans-2-enoyl-CoA reductase family protein [Acholeplasmataceae bacterium]